MRNTPPKHSRTVAAIRAATFAAVTTGLIALSPAPASALTLSDAQAKVVDEISRYYDGVKTISGNFSQSNPNGSQQNGYFVIARPGKLLMRYDKPTDLEIRANGTNNLAIKNLKKDTQQLFPVSKTPFRVLLSDKIDLRNGNTIIGYKESKSNGKTFVAVTLAENSYLGEASLTLTFDKTSRTLTQWIYVDPRKLRFVVNFFNLRSNVKVEPHWFWFDPNKS